MLPLPFPEVLRRVLSRFVYASGRTPLALAGLLAFAAAPRAAVPLPAPPPHARAVLQYPLSLEPAAWVATGGGWVAFGSGRTVTLLRETDPGGPRTTFTASDPVQGAVLYGHEGYLVHPGLGFTALRLQEQGAPVEMGFLALPEASAKWALLGRGVVMGGSDGRLVSVALNPARDCCLRENGQCDHHDEFPPASLSGVPFSTLPAGLAAAASEDSVLYLAGRDGLLRTAKGAAEAAPAVPIPPETSGVGVLDRYLLLALGSRGLWILDRLRGTAGPLLGALDLPCDALATAGRGIYLAGPAGVHFALVQSPQAVTVTVTVNTSTVFTPANVSIVQGDTVKWVRNAGIHTTTSGTFCSGDGLWNSLLNATTMTFSRVFNDPPATYPYFCGNHCALGMTGTVALAASGATARVPYSVNPTRMTTSNHGTDATVTWDAANCPSTGYHILYGLGSDLASAMTTGAPLAGGRCGIGTSGTYLWMAVPDPSADAKRFLWFLVVGDNGGTVEGSWGLTTAGAEEGGTAASGVCGITSKSVAGACGTP